jgi:hypothetical protein
MWSLLAAASALLPLVACEQPDSGIRPASSIKTGQGKSVVDIRLPDYEVDHADAYVCVAVKLPDDVKSIVSIVPHAQQSVVHHMLLFGARPA